MEAISEYAIVMVAVSPNCWNEGIGENASIPNPIAVVSAEPSSAVPVVARVCIAADSGLRTLVNSSR